MTPCSRQFGKRNKFGRVGNTRSSWYNEAMEETVSYSFAVQIYRNDSGTYTYGVFQEIESEDEDDLQLLEVGEADTINEAAEMVGRSLKTLFPA